jgi:hypothetical protein
MTVQSTRFLGPDFIEDGMQEIEEHVALWLPREPGDGGFQVFIIEADAVHCWPPGTMPACWAAPRTVCSSSVV